MGISKTAFCASKVHAFHCLQKTPLEVLHCEFFQSSGEDFVVALSSLAIRTRRFAFGDSHAAIRLQRIYQRIYCLGGLVQYAVTVLLFGVDVSTKKASHDR